MEGIVNTDESYFLPKLLRYCLYQERSSYEVKQILAEWECPFELAERLLNYAIVERFIDDERFAYQYAHGKFTLKKWGKIKIAWGLKTRHQIPPSVIKASLEKAIDADIYYQTLLKLTAGKWMEHKKSTSLATKGAVSRYLQQKGYEWDLIMDAINEIIIKNKDL